MLQPYKYYKFSTDSLVALTFMITPMIPYLSHKGHGDILSFALFFLWLSVVAFRKSNLLMLLGILRARKIELLLLFIFFLVTLYNYFFVSNTSKAFQFLFIPFTYSFAITLDAYYAIRDQRFKSSIFFVLILVLGIQAAISLPYILTSDELISRMYTGGELDAATLIDAQMHGVGSVNLYANLCGIFFLGIAMLKRFRPKQKILVFISLCLILASIASSSYSLCLLLLLLGCIIFLLRANWRKFRFSYILLIASVCVGLIFFYNSVLADSDLIEPIQRKIGLIQSGNLREDGRIDLTFLSLKTFLDNPFFGIGVPDWGLEKEIGEHSSWFDFLAHYGFIGFLPFLCFLAILFKRNFNFYLRSPRENTYATACLIGFVFFVVSNFIDPLIFETPMVIMLIFFYSSMVNGSSATVTKTKIIR